MGPGFGAALSPSPFPSAAVLAALPGGHAAIAFVDVGVGFADRAAVVDQLHLEDQGTGNTPNLSGTS